jgi:hypothetical protein
MIKKFLARIADNEQKSMYDPNKLTSYLSLMGWPFLAAAEKLLAKQQDRKKRRKAASMRRQIFLPVTILLHLMMIQGQVLVKCFKLKFI